MDEQLHRYFMGLVAFAFVVTWTTLGLVTAVLAVVACTALVAGPHSSSGAAGPCGRVR